MEANVPAANFKQTCAIFTSCTRNNNFRGGAKSSLASDFPSFGRIASPKYLEHALCELNYQIYSTKIPFLHTVSIGCYNHPTRK